MVDALSLLQVLSATTTLIEQSIRILSRLKTAYVRQRDLFSVLERHERELESLQSIISVIQGFKELQTPSVGTELVRLREVQTKLAKFLKEADSNPGTKLKGKVSGFARQLTRGSADEKRLSGIMTDLGQVKASLVLTIQAADVGVMKAMGKQLVANTEVIQRIDKYLREHVNECEGLRIAKLLRGRRPSNDGTVPLTPADLRVLTSEDNDDNEDSGDSEEETLIDESESPKRDTWLRTERIILRNVSRKQAIQINAAVGDDIWKELNRLVIKDNIAEDTSIQVNYGTSIEAMKILFEMQKMKIAEQKT